MGENYLFLGGSKDGEVHGVRSGCDRVDVPDYIGGKASPLDRVAKPGDRVVRPGDTFLIEVYIKVNAPTDSGLKVVFVPEGTTVAELHRLINRPIHEIIK